MDSRWRDKDAAACEDELSLRVYSSRLLGQDPSLVLHGGGNTSVKLRERDLYGDEIDVLYVKGSGWDLATIEQGGFAPVRLQPLLKLAQLPQLSDSDMVREQKSQMIRPDAPSPSVEAILHAVLPYTYVDHTHADAVVTLTNSAGGEELIQTLYGDQVLIIPYVMPGFDLAREIAQRCDQLTENTIGLVLMNHGVFSFGQSAQESYERMISLVDQAEQYLRGNQAWYFGFDNMIHPSSDRHEISDLRAELSWLAGKPMIVSVHQHTQAMGFANHPQVHELATRGPATPDHVLRTKQYPLIGRDVVGYVAEYEQYFAQHENGEECLDPTPRVILDPALGLCTVGSSAVAADIVHDIYRHTIDSILRAEKLSAWQSLPAADIFAVEYWELEQAKLKKPAQAQPFAGEVVLITGAASGIGKACVMAFLHQGAAVIAMDINTRVETLFADYPGCLGLCGDIANSEDINQTLEAGVKRFGGLDMLVLCAGLFPSSQKVSELSLEHWQKVMRVNLDANLELLRECQPLLCKSLNYGRVVMIGSRNALAPGPGAAAYSASKAALAQLMRVVALEWADEGIRLNMLHPDCVYDTGIWSEDILQSRANHYGLSVAEYKTRNLLGVEVSSEDVANLCVAMCGPLFAKTTAAQLPVDGGSDRVI